jgi:16S rRNA G966 N2-methylase RsmD
VRQAVMNMLAPELPGCSWLDLCCGSGAMACEALQRGAARVVAVDRDRRHAALARANLEAVAAGLASSRGQAPALRVHHCEALHWLRNSSSAANANATANAHSTANANATANAYVTANANATANASVTANANATAAGHGTAASDATESASSAALTTEGNSFDLIYADPPYAAGLYEALAAAVHQGDWLRAEGQLLLECGSSLVPPVPENWELVDQRRYGSTTLLRLKKAL